MGSDGSDFGAVAESLIHNEIPSPKVLLIS